MRHFPVKQTQSETLDKFNYIKVFSMAFVKEIGRNGVLYSGIWPRHESNQYISVNGKSIAINQIEKKGYQ